MGPKTTPWKQSMEEDPIIAKHGWLYRGINDGPKNPVSKKVVDTSLLKDVHGFDETLFARTVMKYEDGAEYAVGQTVHLTLHRQDPRRDKRFDETRRTIEWTILAIFVGKGKNKIDKKTGPIFLVFRFERDQVRKADNYHRWEKEVSRLQARCPCLRLAKASVEIYHL